MIKFLLIVLLSTGSAKVIAEVSSEHACNLMSSQLNEHPGNVTTRFYCDKVVVI